MNSLKESYFVDLKITTETVNIEGVKI